MNVMLAFIFQRCYFEINPAEFFTLFVFVFQRRKIIFISVMLSDTALALPVFFFYYSIPPLFLWHDSMWHDSLLFSPLLTA